VCNSLNVEASFNNKRKLIKNGLKDRSNTNLQGRIFMYASIFCANTAPAKGDAITKKDTAMLNPLAQPGLARKIH
jgi:hypothetical protein